MLDWHEYFMKIAKVCSERSGCLRANVGAVIVDKHRRVIATGYNGAPSGVKSCHEYQICYRIINNIPSGTQYETCRSIHAEQNAIIQAGKNNTEGCTMYIYGHEIVCILCKRFILQAGIEKVILSKDGEVFTQIDTREWRDSL